MCPNSCPSPRYRSKYQVKYCSPECRKKGCGEAISVAKTKLDPSEQRSGYIYAHVPQGHVSRTGRRKKKHRAPEHIIIAETVLGRPLRRRELVHHLNCSKRDNRHKNLVICDRDYHAWLHGEMSRRYAVSLFGEGA